MTALGSVRPGQRGQSALGPQEGSATSLTCSFAPGGFKLVLFSTISALPQRGTNPGKAPLTAALHAAGRLGPSAGDALLSSHEKAQHSMAKRPAFLGSEVSPAALSLRLRGREG